MTEVKCPKCGKQARLKRYTRPAGVVVGGAAGWITGWQAAAEPVMMLFSCAGPYGAIAGQVAGALLSAAITAFAGGKLGELVDKEIIAKYKCNACGYEFKQ